MTRATLLIEIGCEEIPARMVPQAARDLAAVVVDLLARAPLRHGEVRSLWTPRRLAVVIEDLETSTAARQERVLGPPAASAFDPAGQPTPALRGWASKQGIDPERVERIATEKGDYAAALVDRAPRPLAEVLAAGFERGVAAIPFPKTMRWSDGAQLFVRPVQWLVALADHELLPLSLFGITATRQTRGHRGLAPGPHDVPCACDYLQVLEAARVIADPRRRRQILEDALRRAAAGVGGTLVADDGLLDESCDIVEWPGALTGSFEAHYVDELPAEVLSTCLRHHQKAFSVAGPHGGLLPAFAVAINMPGDPEGHIQRGHEWVVSGRLADALFFWREDRKQPLAARAPRLDGIVFHRELGSFAQKTRRVQRLCASLATATGSLSDCRAAELSRCDLSTGLVGEFPELQGIVGSLLARADGEAEAVAAALAGLYLPAGPDDPLPATAAGRRLGIADRLDTLAGGFAVGLQPSGSKDPFGLRRAGTGLIRLALAEPDLDLSEWCRAALAGHDGSAGPDLRARAGEVTPALHAFLFERFETVAARIVAGARYDELAALAAPAARRFAPADLIARLTALTELRPSEDFRALAAASKRVRNILGQAEGRGEAIAPVAPGTAWATASESALADALGIAARAVGAAQRAREYGLGLTALAALRPVVDRFFEQVLVMDPDPAVRQARLGLLAQLASLTAELVDMSRIVVEGADS